MVQTPAKPLTLEEFLNLPETTPASEYINGDIIQKPMPQGEHSTLQADFVTILNGTLKPSKVGRAYPELRCTFDGRSIVPDVSVFQWHRIPRRANGRVENAFTLLQIRRSRSYLPTKIRPKSDQNHSQHSPLPRQQH